MIYRGRIIQDGIPVTSCIVKETRAALEQHGDEK